MADIGAKDGVEARVATEANLRAVFIAQLEEFRPKVILIGRVPIPRTHTGKIQRKRLVSFFSAYESCSGPTVVASVPQDSSTIR